MSHPHASSVTCVAHHARTAQIPTGTSIITHIAWSINDEVIAATSQDGRVQVRARACACAWMRYGDAMVDAMHDDIPLHVQYDAIRCNMMLCDEMRYDAMQYDAM